MAVECLLGHNAYIKAVIRALETPLMRASQCDQAEVVWMLLANKKTDVNKRDLLGLSALYWAASMRCVKATAAFLEDPRVNANQRAPRRYFGESNTPLRAAWNNRHGEIVKMFERLDLEWRDGQSRWNCHGYSSGNEGCSDVSPLPAADGCETTSSSPTATGSD
ncbi:hypothetical protein L873DRAFT_1791688 [Choiromyces venosus 120613-1]|uniref:Uncharacterized protein n=1 Tax=Choiromyces venosus 120613-1 TaxID=1336337 RepID=A0A3N4JDL1_9PEZI|nr:hypothetical protein L873DRAFT_1791688 [Choiromyces venosus 120613-1]